MTTGLALFFRDVNNKIKVLEKKVESLDALSGSVDEMKGGLKEILGRLGSPNLEEGGTDAPPKTFYTMKHRLVGPNSACLPVPAHKRSADTTVGIVAVDVSADDTGSVAQTSEVKVKERRAMKSTPKNKRKDA